MHVLDAPAGLKPTCQQQRQGSRTAKLKQI